MVTPADALIETKIAQQPAQVGEEDVGIGRSTQDTIEYIVVASHRVSLGLSYHPRPANRPSSGIAAISNPAIASPSPWETSAIMAASR